MLPFLFTLLLTAAPFPSPFAPPPKLHLIRAIPHSGYSEGLDYYQGYLWHALPAEILKIDPKEGSIVKRYKPPTDYSESLAWFQRKLFNLSFSDNSLHSGVISKRGLEFKKIGTVPEIHGWGITQNGRQLIVTGDYSAKLYFLNSKTAKVEKIITTSVDALEDLAWDGAGVWTSSFTSHRGEIFRIDPSNGAIGMFFQLPNPELCPVIDGIAQDGKNLWVTGKHCPSIYLVRNPLLP